MAKKFSELEAKMSPESRARVGEKVKKALAEALNIQQPAIAKMERRTDHVYFHSAQPYRGHGRGA
jgi:hypothetical protein